MAAIRLKHELHGYHYVYTNDELEAHKLLGWEIDQPVKDDEPEKKRGRPARVENGDKHIHRA